MNNHIIHLPKTIQDKIISYLYFSDEVANQIKIVNKIITHYDYYLIKELREVFIHRIITLYFRLSKFINLHPHINDKINQYMNPFLKSIYPDYRFELQTLEHIENVIKHMNIVEKQKMYNYIMFYKR